MTVNVRPLDLSNRVEGLDGTTSELETLINEPLGTLSTTLSEISLTSDGDDVFVTFRDGSSTDSITN